MSSKITRTVWLKQERSLPEQQTYTVERLQNTMQPHVGDRLQGHEVKTLISRGFTIHIS